MIQGIVHDQMCSDVFTTSAETGAANPVLIFSFVFCTGTGDSVSGYLFSGPRTPMILADGGTVEGSSK